MFPIVVGLNHRTAPVEVREKVSFRTSEIQPALQELRKQSALEGVVLLSTCNRLEIYASTSEVDAGINSIKRFLANHANLKEEDFYQYLYTHTLYDSVRHLFRVVSGLDSMVLGETQILGQVSDAYEMANEAGVTNKVINVFFQTSLTVGKRVRTETQIDQHPTSISYTAVELAKQVFGDLAGRSILILGAGEMSALTAKHLVANGASTVMVSNRSYERAKALAAEFNGEAIHYEDFDRVLVDSDIVISATAAPNFIIQPERMSNIMANRKNRQLLMIDIAVPRDINPEVGNIEGITLYDIDDLRGVVDSHHEARQKAAKTAENIIEEEMEQFLKWHNSLAVVPTIIALQKKAEEMKNALLRSSLNKMGELTPKQEKTMHAFANSLVKHLLHAPITNLKEAANTNKGHLYTEILQSLFNLEMDTEEKQTTNSSSIDEEKRMKQIQ